MPFQLYFGTLFNMAFSNIENSEKLKIIDIAIVANKEFKENEICQKALETLSDEENKNRLFNTKYVTEEEAQKLLQEREITGYMVIKEGKPKVIFQSNGVNETVFKYVIEEITQNSEITNMLAEEKIKKEIIAGNDRIDYKKIYENVAEKIKNEEAKIRNIANSNLSYTMIEFYTLIAMTCLYGGTLGMVAINQNLANMSSNGKRVSITPTNKAKVILSSVLAAYVIQVIGLALLFVYTIFILKVDYGNNLPLVFLLGGIGSLAGLSMGLAIGTLFKSNEGIKTGILISVTMLGCFLSGMMGITMKYIIDTNLPIVNKINPASMITDGFYSLYYYDTLDRYYFNIVSLCIFTILMIVVSYFSLRKQKFQKL